MPDIEKKETFPAQMPGRVCKRRRHVSITDLVTDNMEKSDHAIKKPVQSYCLNVTSHAIQAACTCGRHHRFTALYSEYFEAVRFQHLTVSAGAQAKFQKRFRVRLCRAQSARNIFRLCFVIFVAIK